MLNEIENRCIKILNSKYFNSKDNKLNEYVNDIILIIVEIYQKYKDPIKIDKLSEVKKDIKDISNKMRESINDVVNNIEYCNELNDKSQKINLISGDYKRGATKLRTASYMGNLKIKIILAIIIIALFLFIFWLLFLK